MATKVKAKAKAVKSKTIDVKYGRLTEPLEVMQVDTGMGIVEFMQLRESEFGPSVRVNGEEVSERYILRAGDIITDIDEVSGGC